MESIQQSTGRRTDLDPQNGGPISEISKSEGFQEGAPVVNQAIGTRMVVYHLGFDGFTSDFKYTTCITWYIMGTITSDFRFRTKSLVITPKYTMLYMSYT